jgi:hypothetical protein
MAQHLIVEKVEITKDNDNIENKYLYKISLKPIYIVWTIFSLEAIIKV